MRRGCLVHAVMQVASDPPIGPASPQQLLHHRQFMLLSVEIARNEARAPAKGSQLLKRSPQCIAELLLLASRAAGDAVGRDVAAAASAAEADAGRCHPGGELAKRRQLNLLPLARAVQHRRQAR